MKSIRAGLRKCAWLALACLVVTCSGGPAESVALAAPAGGAASPAKRATLDRSHGVLVLTLDGDPYQRGYDHGKLLAQGVLDMVDTVCGTNLLLSHRSDYAKVILPMMDRFKFEPDDEKEIRGIYDGVRAALGDKAVLKRIGRPLTIADLKAYNTAGDWYRQACSSFGAWGKLTKDGHVWVGRNFDFMPAESFFENQLIIIHRPCGKSHAWATVSAPGMIGCITGINDAGVFVSVHDVFLTKRELAKGYTPRLLVLRRLMEQCDARDLVKQVKPILEARRQMFDNNVFVAAPVTDGTPPAVVFEYNDDCTTDKGVTVRTAADNESKMPGEMLACTNHYRKRVKPKWNPLNYRYPLIGSVVRAKTRRGELVDFDIARKVMGAVRLPITAHTVIADLNTMDFWYAAGDFLSPPGKDDFVKLPIKRWLSGGERGLTTLPKGSLRLCG